MPKPALQERLNWGRFRFAIIGPLLAAPPPASDLQAQLRKLAQKQWIYPCDPTRTLQVSRSTIERALMEWSASLKNGIVMCQNGKPFNYM